MHQPRSGSSCRFVAALYRAYGVRHDHLYRGHGRLVPDAGRNRSDPEQISCRQTQFRSHCLFHQKQHHPRCACLSEKSGSFIRIINQEGKIVERDINETGDNITKVTFKTALATADQPVANGVWTITEPDRFQCGRALSLSHKVKPRVV